MWARGLACLLLLASRTARGQDRQLWSEIDVSANWSRVGLTAPLVARSDTKLSTISFIASGLTADLRLPWQTTVTAGELIVDLRRHPSTIVRVPLLAVSNGLQVGRVLFSVRNRLEQLRGNGVSPTRYRNRFGLDSPLVADGAARAFADYESFYDVSAGHWTQHRARAGLGYRVHSGATVDLYYLQRGAGGTTTRVVGATVKLTLNHVNTTGG